MELSGRLHAPAALLPGRNLGTCYVGGWVGHRDGVDVFKEEKGSCPCRDSNPWLSSALLLGPVIIITIIYHHSVREFRGHESGPADLRTLCVLARWMNQEPLNGTSACTQ